MKTRDTAGGPPRPASARNAGVLSAVIGADLILLAGTVLAVYQGPGLARQYLYLGAETNPAVWWSAMTQVFVALLFLDAAREQSEWSTAQRLAGWTAALLLLGLSLDELGSLHERILPDGSLTPAIPFVLVGLLMLGFTLRVFLGNDGTRRGGWLLLIGFACYGSVFGQEVLEHKVTWPDSLLGVRVAIEEGSELLGTLLCLAAALSVRGVGIRSTPLRDVLPRERPPLSFLIGATGLALHIPVAFIAVQLDGYPGLGNPAMWFPALAFFAAAVGALRTSLTGARRFGVTAVAFVVVSLLASLGHGMFTYPLASTSTLAAVNGVACAFGLLYVVANLPAGQRTGALVNYALPLAMGVVFLLAARDDLAFVLSGCAGWAVLTSAWHVASVRGTVAGAGTRADADDYRPSALSGAGHSR